MLHTDTLYKGSQKGTRSRGVTVIEFSTSPMCTGRIAVKIWFFIQIGRSITLTQSILEHPKKFTAMSYILLSIPTREV